MKAIRCPHCGSEHPASWRFCDKTGMALEPPQRDNSFGAALLYGVGLAIIVTAGWLLRPIIWPSPQPTEPSVTAISATAIIEPTADNPISQPGQSEENGYQFVSLESIANHPMDHLITPLSGKVEFAGIPFSILSGPKAVFQSQNQGLPGYPINTKLTIAVPNATSVDFLMGGAYVLRES